MGLRNNVNTSIPRVNGLGQQSLVKTVRHHIVEYMIPSFKTTTSLFVSTPTHSETEGACSLWHPQSPLTVSDSAMQTKVNFLMWAEVTVLLVFASLLLGLFWGKRMTAVTKQAYPQLSPQITKNTLFYLTCLEY